MSGDQERVQRAREAYDRASVEASRLAIEASRAAAAAELARVAQNVQRLASARTAAFARLEAKDHLGVQMVYTGNVTKYRGVFRKPETVPAYEPGWQVYSDSTEGPTHAAEHVYLMADSAFIYNTYYQDDMSGVEHSSIQRVSLDELASWKQAKVGEITAELDRLGIPQLPMKPYVTLAEDP